MTIFSKYKDDFSRNLKLATPIMAGQLGQISVNVADNLMVGRLGAASLAAVSLSVSVFIVFYVVAMGISFALPPLVAEADGSKSYKRISQYFKHSLVINLLFAFISIAVVEGGIPFISVLGQDPEVVQLAIPYLRLSIWSLIPMMIFQTFRCYSDGMSRPVISMIVLVIGNLLNIFLNYLLIYGKFGSPQLGVAGAAWGTMISRIVMMFLLIGMIYYRESLWIHIRKANFKKFRRSLFMKNLSLGIPTSLQMFFEVSAFAGAAIIMGKISKEAQAAHQIAINLSAISFLICTGLSMASTIRVGNQLGLKSMSGIRNAGFSAFIQVIIFMSLVAIFFVSLRHYLPLLYIGDKLVVEIASGLLILAAIFQIPDGMQVTALGALRGMQDVYVPTGITFIAYWLFGLPISYYCAFYSSLGSMGVWLGLVIGLSISASLLSLRFHLKTRSTQLIN